MWRYRVECILGVIFLVLFIGVCYWASGPSKKLTHKDVDAYIARIQQGLPMPEPEKGELLARFRAWGEADDGRSFYMVNLLSFKNPIEPWPGVEIKTTTAEETYQFYVNAVGPMALRVGIWPSIRMKAQGTGSGKSNVQGLASENDGWNLVAVNRYPSRRAALEMFSSPDYMRVMAYKEAAARLIVLPVSGGIVLPDVRIAVGVMFMLVFLLVGWIRSATTQRAD